MSIQYEELMSAELGISTKTYWQCGVCATKEEVYFYYITFKTIPNEIHVRCESCLKQVAYLCKNSTKLTDKEAFLIKLRDDFN